MISYNNKIYEVILLSAYDDSHAPVANYDVKWCWLNMELKTLNFDMVWRVDIL